MLQRLNTFIEESFQPPGDDTQAMLERVLIVLAAAAFVLISTITIALEEIFPELDPISSLQVGDVAPLITAPADITITSDVLTEQARQSSANSVQPIYDPPDPNVAQRQTQQAQRILAFIQNVRRDTYATTEQKIADLNQITALTIDEEIARLILQFDDETWSAIEQEILNVIPLVMRNSIRADNLSTERTLLPNQVGLRFEPNEREVIVAIAEDLIRPNTFENPEETESAREAAVEAVQPVELSFVRGESIVTPGTPVGEVEYEVLQRLGLLQNSESRVPSIARALIASLLVLSVSGLYLLRFTPHLLTGTPSMLTLLGTIYLITLILTRVIGINGNIYLFPAAAMALLFVAISGPHIALLGSVSLGFQVGLMAQNNLEIVALITGGSIMGVLTLRRAERLNSFFMSGLALSVVNAAVITIFSLTGPTVGEMDLATKLLISVSSGALLVPAAAIAFMYVLSFVFNLPTALKLIDLAQPNKPMLHKLLRDAPGTYQHSLQVANLSTQAANAIGADAQLTNVAALYHDIGKMENPIFFTENQTPNMGNPHDALNDPYRSADIIIGHVTLGDEMAKAARLPRRIRDFIREHHGTTQVYVFYKQAVEQAGGDESAVDLEEFTYPGPRPRSKETAIMMLADSCEAAVRSEKPESKEAIKAIVESVINGKRDQGQLDKSNLTLNDLREIKTIFVDILQGMFHPRINYKEAIRPRNTDNDSQRTMERSPAPPSSTSAATQTIPTVRTNQRDKTRRQTTPTAPAPASVETDDNVLAETEDEAPIEEVPRLPSADERRTTGSMRRVVENGKHKNDTEDQDAEKSAKSSDDA